MKYETNFKCINCKNAESDKDDYYHCTLNNKFTFDDIDMSIRCKDFKFKVNILMQLHTVSTNEYLRLKKYSTDNDIFLFIVRSPGKLLNDSKLIHVPQLAPSQELFKQYLQWQDEEPTIWFDEYKRIFIEEKHNDAEYNRRIDRIIQRLQEGKNVYLICFCGNEQYCHRSLVKQHIEALLNIQAFKKDLINETCNWCKHYDVKNGHCNMFHVAKYHN